MSRRGKIHVMMPANSNEGSEQMPLRVGEKIPVSGIYRVHHRDHRSPHEVTLLRDETFPPCAKCGNCVYFELVTSLPGLENRDFHIRLFAIPDEGTEAA